MKKVVKLAFSYLRYYKKQTLALLAGMILSAGILTGIGSLFYSGRQAALENARVQYGDWQYSLWCSEPWFEEFLSHPEGKGFQIETYGVKTIKKTLEEPYEIQLVSADTGYLQMMGRKLLEGQMPNSSAEIAMDLHTLRNLDLSRQLGSTLELDEQTYTLCGILTEMPAKLQEDGMEIFVSPESDYGYEGKLLYLKFQENGNIYKQAAAFADAFAADKSTIARNNGIAGYLGGESPAQILETIRVGLWEEGTGLPYIWGQLNEDGSLTHKAVLAALGLFGAFILYSLFQISVMKRMSQYSLLQTLGLTDGLIFQVLLAELLLLFVLGYPLGCLLGNGAAALVYGRIGRVFVTQEAAVHTGAGTQEQALASAASALPDTGSFQVDGAILAAGLCFSWSFWQESACVW